MSNYEFVELIIRLIGDGLALSSQTVGSFIESLVAGKARWENDCGIAPMDLSNSLYDGQLHNHIR